MLTALGIIKFGPLETDFRPLFTFFIIFQLCFMNLYQTSHYFTPPDLPHHSLFDLKKPTPLRKSNAELGGRPSGTMQPRRLAAPLSRAQQTIDTQKERLKA